MHNSNARKMSKIKLTTWHLLVLPLRVSYLRGATWVGPNPNQSKILVDARHMCGFQAPTQLYTFMHGKTRPTAHYIIYILSSLFLVFIPFEKKKKIHGVPNLNQPPKFFTVRDLYSGSGLAGLRFAHFSFRLGFEYRFSTCNLTCPVGFNKMEASSSPEHGDLGWSAYCLFFLMNDDQSSPYLGYVW